VSTKTRTSLRVLIAGAWQFPAYEKAFAGGLRNNGVEVLRFETASFFRGVIGKPQLIAPCYSPASRLLNRALLEYCRNSKPDVVLLWRPTHVFPETIRSLRERGFLTVSYNNDDPFHHLHSRNLPWNHYLLWRLYLRCLPHFDRNFFYREVNRQEALNLGAPHAAVLLPYFVPESDRPIALSAADLHRYETDVVFVGHYEPDGRAKSIAELVEAGLKVKVWGNEYWKNAKLGGIYDRIGPIAPVFGDEYAKALCGAKVCLTFLSALNRDTYTRRCFEIPACGRVMLAQRTSDLQRLFTEDREACFFSDGTELLSKLKWLLADDNAREEIAIAGRDRVWRDGHDVTSRVREFLGKLNG
jgi:hypothetical protein